MRTPDEINNELDLIEQQFHNGKLEDEQYAEKKKQLRAELSSALRSEGAKDGQEAATTQQKIQAGYDLLAKKGEELAVKLYGDSPSKMLTMGAKGAMNAHYNSLALEEAKRTGKTYLEEMHKLMHDLTEEGINKVVDEVRGEHETEAQKTVSAKKEQKGEEAKKAKGDPAKTHEDDAQAAKDANVEEGAGGASITPDGSENKDTQTVSNFINNTKKNKFKENLDEFTGAVEAAARIQAGLDGSQNDVLIMQPNGEKLPISA